MAKKRVLIADDHLLMRAGLRTLLLAIPEVDVVAEAVQLTPVQVELLRGKLVAQRAARTFSVDAGEFTIEDEKLYMLQCRTGKRLPQAAFKIAVDMVKEKLITKEEAVGRVTSDDIERLFYPVIDPKTDKKVIAAARLASGINAHLLRRPQLVHVAVNSAWRRHVAQRQVAHRPHGNHVVDDDHPLVDAAHAERMQRDAARGKCARRLGARIADHARRSRSRPRKSGAQAVRVDPDAGRARRDRALRAALPRARRGSRPRSQARPGAPPGRCAPGRSRPTWTR